MRMARNVGVGPEEGILPSVLAQLFTHAEPDSVTASNGLSIWLRAVSVLI